jgi:hypothetical protein
MVQDIGDRDIGGDDRPPETGGTKLRLARFASRFCKRFLVGGRASLRCLLSLQCWWRWGRVLWVCRISALSAIGGGILLARTPQARDLFADIGMQPTHWASFLVLLAVWSWAVHVLARRSLQYEDWVLESHVAGGLTMQRRRQLREAFHWPALLVPRLLGLSVFGFVASAIWRTRENLTTAADGLLEAREALTLTTMLFWSVIALAALYVLFVWHRRKAAIWLSHTRLHWPESEGPLLTGRTPKFAARNKAYIEAEPSTAGRTLAVALGMVWLVILVVLALTLVDPHMVASGLPRLLFAPLLFAGIAVLLSEVAAWSHRRRTPFLLFVSAGAALSLYYVEHYHDVRWFEGTPKPSIAVGPEQQIRVGDAVERWMVANDCSVEYIESCPRPILIAGAGGASRAAFLTATVVGALIDLGNDPARRGEFGNIRNRIFALSTVSGSSVGAVVIRAALADAAERKTPDMPPCRSEPDSAWFGRQETAEKVQQRGFALDPRHSWRDCFQQILAGDFLSPVLVGLTYRDNFPLLNPISRRPLWADRATLLEQGFERRYHRLTSEIDTGHTCGDPDGAGRLHDLDQTGLCRRFGYHPDPKIAGAWLPLLFINGTSVLTGRRIIAGDIRASDRYKPGKVLFKLAYDLNEIATYADAQWAASLPAGKRPATLRRDIRLSTAATMSARFPIISPHGNLRNRAGDISDRIVDGGYFENDGLATVTDVIWALKDFGLDPVVIRIVNEPAVVAAQDNTLGPDRPTVPDKAERTPFDDMTSIVRALTATRSGHEEGHLEYLKSAVPAEKLFQVGVYDLKAENLYWQDPKSTQAMTANPLCRRTIKIDARLEHVSMSWWMSQPVQAYLDAQLCVRANWARLYCEMVQGKAAYGDACQLLEIEEAQIASMAVTAPTLQSARQRLVPAPRAVPSPPVPPPSEPEPVSEEPPP